MVSLDVNMQPEIDRESIDFGSMFRAVLKHSGKIAILTAVTTLVALYNVLTATPNFVADGSMYLGDAQSTTDGGADPAATSSLNFMTSFATVSDIQTVVELIQSRHLIEQAILSTGLNSPVTPENRADMPYWKWKLVYHNSVQAFAPQPGDVQALYAAFDEPSAGSEAYNIVFHKGGNYTISTLGGWFSSPVEVLAGTLNQPASGGGLSLMVKPAIDGAYPTDGSRFLLNVTSAQNMASGIVDTGAFSVNAGGTDTQPSKNANLSFTSTNPYTGTAFVNQIMASYIGTQLQWETQSASTTEGFVSNQLAKISAAMSTADTKLAQYQAKTGIVDVITNGQTANATLSQYEVQKVTLQLQQTALRGIFEDLNHSTVGLNPYLSSQVNDPVLQRLVGELTDAEVQLETMRAEFSGISHNVVVQEATVRELRASIRAIIQNDLEQTNQSLVNLNTQIAQYQAKMAHIPAQNLEITALTRSSSVLGDIYVLLEDEEQKALVSKASTIVNTRIVTPAELPLKNTTPSPKKDVLIGILIGLATGVGIALALRTFSRNFLGEDEIKRFTNLPVYGLIPFVSKLEAGRGTLTVQPRSHFAEAFRLLRSNLYLSRSAQKSTVIMVISASSADGKTAVAANLAKSLADDGKRVIVVDADLYLGNLSKVFDVDGKPGLVEWLTSGTASPYPVVLNEQFAVLPAGSLPERPAELLNGAIFKEVIAKLREEFDFVILDSPPLPVVSDGMTLGQNVNLILSVVNIGSTPRKAFALHLQAIKGLDQRHGIVINSVIPSQYGQVSEYGRERTSSGTGETLLLAFTRRLRGL